MFLLHITVYDLYSPLLIFAGGQGQNTRASITASSMNSVLPSTLPHPKFSANSAQQRVIHLSYGCGHPIVLTRYLECFALAPLFYSYTFFSPMVAIHVLITLFLYKLFTNILCLAAPLPNRTTSSASSTSPVLWFTRQTPSSTRTWTSCPTTPTCSSTGA